MKATALGLAMVAATALIGFSSVAPVGAAERSHSHVGHASPGTHYAVDKPVCTTAPKPGYAACMAVRAVPASKGTPGARPYTVPAAFPVGPSRHGLTPGDLATAYGFDPDRPIGASQLVAIVDAYDDPNIESDLNQFDLQYSLPEETPTSFIKVGQTGSPTLPTTDTSGWSLEEALDVEAVRGVCHTCRILLVETNSPQDSNLWAGVRTAMRMHATEISNSYGGPEGGHIPKSIAKEIEHVYRHPGTVITAATGDEGWYTWDRVNDGNSASAHSPNFPASLPNVVGVGGTTLRLNSDGTRRSERVWNNNGPADSIGFHHHRAQGGTGGGCSVTYKAKGWQAHVPGYRLSGCGSKRGAADISVDGDPQTGYDVYTSFTCASGCPSAPGWYPVGGTSLSSPVVAAMWALAGGSGGVGFPSLSLYGHANSRHPPLYDVTSGGNSWCDGVSYTRCAKATGRLTKGHVRNPNFLALNGHNLGALDCGFKRHTHRAVRVAASRQCNAAPGYDGPSGIGTPNGLAVFRPMSPRPKVTHRHAVAKARTQFAAGGHDPFPGGRFVTFHWRFGDGRGSHKAAPRHTYDKPGRYLVTLTVTDTYGQTATVTGRARVHHR